MRDLREAYLLVQSLSKGEKRQITLAGRAKSGSKESAHLRLFEWLANLKHYRHEEAETTPFLLEIGGALPTVARRMQSLVVSTLSGMTNSKSQAMQLDLAWFEARLLVKRRLFRLAAPAIRRGIDLAFSFGQYSIATALLDLHRTIHISSPGPETENALLDLAITQRTYRQFQASQQELHHLHAMALTLNLQGVTSRSPSAREDWSALMAKVEKLAVQAGPDLISRSLVSDLRGQDLVTLGKGTKALEIYTPLIREWRNDEYWIRESPGLYIQLFRNYQRSIFFGTWDEEVLTTYLNLLPKTTSLPETIRLDFQRINYSHQLTIGLNQAKFDLLLPALCNEILEWVTQNSQVLSESVRMAFHYNIAIVYFLAGDFGNANRQVQLLLNWKRGTSRQDIRHFVRILEPILMYEKGERDLNSYVERRSRRYLKQQPLQMEFETSVLDYIRQLLTDNHSADSARDQLAARLSDLVQKTSRPTPMLGLFEVQIWLESQTSKLPILTTFQNYLDRMKQQNS